jgi:hypothetical protein
MPISKFILSVIEFCGIHLLLNFQFLTWYLYVKENEHIESTSPLSLLLRIGFLSKPREVFWTASDAEPLAIAFAIQHIIDCILQTKYLDPRIHELMDVEVSESDRSTSHSMIASSNITDSKDGST